MKQKITLLLFIISFLSLKGNAQTQFWSDTFEDTGAPSSGTRTPSLNQGGPGLPYTYYFLRTDGSDIALQAFVFPETSNSYQSIQGSKFWAGEDTDRVATGTNDQNDKVQNITWTGINIGGKSGLTFKGLFAANNGHDWQNFTFGITYDFIEVEYRIDGGAWVLAGGIYPNTSNGNAGRMSEDTNGDKIGDGTLLSRTFQEFNWNIIGTGTTMDLRFRVSADAGATQEFAIDNFRLFEAPPCNVVMTAASQTNVSCFGGSNGTAAVNAATGGTAPYTYNWTPGNPVGDGTVSVTGLTAGTWTCTVTDLNGCNTTTTFTITQPTAISSSVSSITNISCNGGSNGSITISASGGTPGYTYSWAPSGGSAATATGLSAGTYTCTITDANGCTKTQSATVTQPTAIGSSISAQTNVSCNGGSNGSATVAVSGGTSGYTYSWAPSGGSAATATGLTAGTYTCTITDANACTKTQSVTITQPTAIGSSISAQTNVSCNGGSNGSATVAVSGGTSGYTYSWAPSGGSAATATGLTAGTYTCTITDANACTKTQSVTITQPTAIGSSISAQTNVSCNGGSNGSATVAVSGGTSGYTYSWAPSGGSAATATGLTAGTYTCTITDANACTKTQSVTITQPSTALVAFANTDNNVSCNGGSNGGATASATGGTAPYTYAWSNGATTASITGIVAGTYNVTITDANGCSEIVFVSITEPAAIDNTIMQSGGVLTANQASASYQWFTCPNNSIVGATNQSYTPTIAGDYKVQVTIGGCTVESSCETVTVLGTNTFENNLTFSIYPNPSNGLLTIKTSIDGDFIIANQLGQTVKSFKVNAGIENTINVENLSDGIYFVKGTNGTQISSQRLIIKK